MLKKCFFCLFVIMCVFTQIHISATVSTFYISGGFLPRNGIDTVDIYFINDTIAAAELENASLTAYNHTTAQLDAQGRYSKSLTADVGQVTGLYIRYADQSVLKKPGSFLSHGISGIDISEDHTINLTGKLNTDKKQVSVLLFKPDKTYADLSGTGGIDTVIANMQAAQIINGAYSCEMRAETLSSSYHILVSSGDEFIFMPAVGFTDNITIYVSPIGNDENLGTVSAPLRTIQAAKTRVADLSKTAPVSVIFGGGIYNTGEGTTFEATDSGSDAYPVTYKAAEGEKPLFIGTKSVDMSVFHTLTDADVLARLGDDAKGRVLEADLGSLGFTSQMLNFTSDFTPGSTVSELGVYYNKKRQMLSRWPNNGYERFENVINGGGIRRNGVNEGVGAVFTVNAENVRRWTQAGDAYIAGYFGSEYFSEWAKVKSISMEDRAIELTDWTQYGVKTNYKWYITNLLEEMDIPGEWYIEQDNLKLYYYPPEGFGKASDTVEISVLEEPFITVNNAQNIIFDGIGLSMNKSDGMVVNGGRHITIQNCDISETKGNGLKLSGNELTVQTSRIYNTKNTGIYMNECGNRNTLTTSGNVIRNNHIFNTGTDSGSNWNGGIRIGANTVGNIIENNLLHGIKNYSYSFGGNDNVFQYNEVWNGNRETADSGPIYCGRHLNEYGNAILYNYIHDCYNFESNIYGNFGVGTGDDWQSGTVIKNNIINMGIKTKTYANSTHSRDNIMQYNIQVCAYKGLAMGDRYRYIPNMLDPSISTTADLLDTLNSGEGLDEGFATTEAWMAKYPQISTILDDITVNNGRFMTRGNVITDNVSVDAPNSMDDPLMAQISTVERNLDISNYGIFVDPAHHDYRITSAAMQQYNLNGNIINENNFSMDDIGIQTPVNPADGSFSLTYPYNAQTGVNVKDLTIAWEKADFADEYTYSIATDAEFNNVVKTGRTLYNNATIDALQRNTKYYWKVTAKNLSKQIGGEWVNENGVYSFTTDSSVLSTGSCYMVQNGNAYNAEIIMNNNANELIKFTAIFASYSADNELLGTNVFSDSIQTGVTNEKHTYTVNRYEDASTILILVWNNISQMNPLIKALHPVIYEETAANELIYDVASDEYEESGTWANGSETGYNSGTIRVSSSSDAGATWSISTENAGRYKIEYWMSPLQSGNTGAPVTVTTMGGISGFETVQTSINFTQAASGWHELCEMDIASPDGSGFVQINISGANIMASAVKLTEIMD